MLIVEERPFSSKVVGEDGRLHHRSQLETAVLHNPFLPANMIKSQGRYGLETEEEEWIGEDAVHSHQEDRAGAGGWVWWRADKYGADYLDRRSV
ncbi:MAG: hypothetical protein DWQ04_23180 [Chloroflexi bacterium]|nr:MAG: hypothetical protein DWQ04_23180 [Chloroflexota bacterium]